MLFSRQPPSLKTSGFYGLLTLCAIVFFYEFWTLSSTQGVRDQHTEPPSPPPPPPPAEIPKIIWYKLGPRGLNDNTRRWTESCISKNPNYRAEFLTDESADQYVKTAFVSRPDIVESYLGLTVPILKADLLRYLLLWDQGGIWSDLDVSCEDIKIDDWVPSKYKDTAGIVVGWEFDVGWDMAFVRQFASWTIMAKPRSPHMLQVIDDILDTLHEKMAKYQVPVGKMTLEMTGDVVDFSGPRRLTFGILKSLGTMLNRTVEGNEMKEILQPVLMGDVLVMPGRSFATTSNRYKPYQEQYLPPQLVTHHYAGSWKNAHGGEAV
jgi:alpha 1,6-mannosyltransferase